MCRLLKFNSWPNKRIPIRKTPQPKLFLHYHSILGGPIFQLLQLLLADLLIKLFTGLEEAARTQERAQVLSFEGRIELRGNI